MKSKSIKILALLLAVCAFLGVTSCSLFETEEATTEPRSDSLTPIESLVVKDEKNAPLFKVNDKNAIVYFNSLMAKLNANEVKATISYSSDYDFNSFECESAELKAGLDWLAKLMKDGFNSYVNKDNKEFKYGENFASVLPIKGTDKPLVLKPEDIAVYKTPEGEEAQYAEGHTLIFVNEEALSRYEEASSRDTEAMKDDPEATTEYIEIDEDIRKITITLKDETDPQNGANLFGEIYNIPDRAFIKQELDKLSGTVTYDGTYKATYTGCQIYMEVDRTTDQVLKLEFRRNIEVEMNVTGVGALASIGTTPIKFKVTGADVYEFDYTDPNAQPAE